MAKKEKKTAEQQYREILESYGRRFEDCKVLAFEFEGKSGTQMFHLEIMNPFREHPVYHIFDGIENVAQIVIDNTDEDEKAAKQLARLCGGKPVKPNLK